MAKKKQLSLIQARHNAGLARRDVAYGLRITMDSIRKFEYQLETPPDNLKKKLADFYQVSVDDIKWKYKMSEITIASQMMDVSPLTMRKYLQQGKLGMAVKGQGNKFIYRIDWMEIEKWEKLNYS